MLQIGVAELEATMDAADWDAEDFDRLPFHRDAEPLDHGDFDPGFFDVDIDRISVGDLEPDQIPFDFDEPDEDRSGAGRRNNPSRAERSTLVDELNDPVRYIDYHPIWLEMLAYFAPPDLRNGHHAIRVAQFGLCLAALMLANAVMMLVMLF